MISAKDFGAVGDGVTDDVLQKESPRFREGRRSTEKESDWVTIDTCFFKNSTKGFDVKQLQIEPTIE